ncbi:30S ribosomal protein S15 [Candidatus Berkelbacteria bacterium]|nr:30S ribosomal protein S15 [Candidatus Berkelbacteria bacterium]MBI2588266.1 30S ribosomal protein S15 [Candidatus Berkelbacteria bacterium]MBI4029949.1 30S ribosomal protein S15 [Candidatus Berkelbacteria bacterium]
MVQKIVVKPDTLLKKYRKNVKDTGSAEVQIILATQRILELAAHLKKHSQDFDSKRGLLILIGKRRRLLNYLRQKEMEKYQKLVVDLGLRK